MIIIVQYILLTSDLLNFILCHHMVNKYFNLELPLCCYHFCYTNEARLSCLFKTELVKYNVTITYSSFVYITRSHPSRSFREQMLPKKTFKSFFELEGSIKYAASYETKFAYWMNLHLFAYKMECWRGAHEDTWGTLPASSFQNEDSRFMSNKKTDWGMTVREMCLLSQQLVKWAVGVFFFFGCRVSLLRLLLLDAG